MMLKLLLSVSVVVLLYILCMQEPEIVDRTETYQNKVDSLEVIIETKNRIIELRDKNIHTLNQKNDSLISYQYKIYRYYAKKKSNIANIPDSSFNSYFSRLVNNR